MNGLPDKPWISIVKVSKNSQGIWVLIKTKNQEWKIERQDARNRGKIVNRKGDQAADNNVWKRYS